MSDVISMLRKLDFPACSQRALKQLGSCFAPGSEAIPGLGAQEEELAEQLARDFIFFETPSRNGQTKKLSALQELQLLELFIKYFSDEENDDVQHPVFKILFSASLDGRRHNVLFKLVSMAIGVRNTALLECAAVWMQRQGCGSEVSVNMAEVIVRDYCVLVPSAVAILSMLPDLSVHFTCNLMTAITTIYQPPGGHSKHKQDIPAELLNVLTCWVEGNPQLCLAALIQSKNGPVAQLEQRSSLWTSPTKPNTQTPVPGLVRWCTQDPLLSRNPGNSPWSRLHLALLQTLMAFPAVTGANQLELLTLADMHRIVRELTSLLDTTKDQANSADVRQLAVDRLVQVLQVGLATGAFRCSLADLQGICNSIPQNKLLTILQAQHLALTPPPMHHEAR